MSGYSLILKIRRLEEELEDMGMRWGHDKHGRWGEGSDDVVSIFPLGENLPVYSRDACMFTGTINEVDRWLQGVKWARNYDMLMKVSDEKKRERKEQDERNRQLVQRIKLDQVERKANA